MGVGVRHAGDDGLLPIVFPGWSLQIKEPCWGYMMYAIIIVRIYRSMWK